MGFEITRIDTRSLRKEFIGLPWKIYGDDPSWVPPLKQLEEQRISPKHNPFLKYGRISLFAAMDDSGKMVGRIAAVMNPVHNRIHDPEDGFFGMFECIKDLQAARMLIEAAEQEIRSWGLTSMIGPVNFTTNDESGFLIKGYESPPAYRTNYCPGYYPQYMEELGYRKQEDLYSFLWKKGHAFPERFETMAERVAGNQGIRIRKFREKEMKVELKTVQQIYNQSFQGLRGFVPLNKDEIRAMFEGFRQFADFDIILIGEYKDEPVGICLTLPDLNRILPELDGKILPFGEAKFRKRLSSLKHLRLALLGIMPGYRNRGIVLLLIRQLVEEALKKGYESCELSVIMESNTNMMGLIGSLGFIQEKKFRIYQKKIGKD